MLAYSDRRGTLRWAKIGPPLRRMAQFTLSGWLASLPKGGRVRKPAGLRRVAGTGSRPALRHTPCQRAS